MITLILGRDGMGEATEEDFQRWADFVCEKIDGQCGFDVYTDERDPRDVQSDFIRGGTEAVRAMVEEAKT